MSVGVFGTFHIMKNLNNNEQINKLSFFIAKAALDSDIWVNQGINVSDRAKYFLEKIHKRSKFEKIFELSDNPMDSNAECLFGGDGIEIYVGDNRVDQGISLKSRMLNVQQFFNSIFSSGMIDKVELYVNIESGDEYETKYIEVCDFCEAILKVYEDEDWTPSIKFSIISSGN